MNRLVIALVATLGIPAALQAQTNDAVTFSFDTPAVNHAIISAYDASPAVWSNGNLFIVGVCCVKEQQYDKAQQIFARLTNDVPANARYSRAYANAAHLNGDFSSAYRVFKSLWSQQGNVAALKGLGITAVQQQDVHTLRDLVDDFTKHKAEDFDLRQVLVMYSLIETDVEKGGRAYASAVTGLKESEVNDNAEFRKLLMMATLKYKEAAEQAESTVPSEAAPSAASDVR
jgi:hypothetical protein